MEVLQFAKSALPNLNKAYYFQRIRPGFGRSDLTTLTKNYQSKVEAKWRTVSLVFQQQGEFPLGLLSHFAEGHTCSSVSAKLRNQESCKGSSRSEIGSSIVTFYKPFQSGCKPRFQDCIARQSEPPKCDSRHPILQTASNSTKIERPAPKSGHSNFPQKRRTNDR